jgi:hypothetical protein
MPQMPQKSRKTTQNEHYSTTVQKPRSAAKLRHIAAYLRHSKNEMPQL